MARPKKTGLDYFPFDVGFFEDEKMACIAGEFGLKGEIVAVKLLCAVYRNGYFILWNDAMKMKMLRTLPGISAELFDQILNRLVRWGFFSASLFDSVKVLTSAGIQRRYFAATKRRLQDEELPYLLISKMEFMYTETPINVAETPVNVYRNPQIKGNKIKKEKSPNGDTKKGGEPHQEIMAFKEKPGKSVKEPIISSSPTLEDVKRHFVSVDACKRLDDWERTAMQFFDYFNAVGWIDGRGRAIKNWESRANSWIFKEEDIQKTKQRHETQQTDRFSERRGVEPGSRDRENFEGEIGH